MKKLELQEADPKYWLQFQQQQQQKAQFRPASWIEWIFQYLLEDWISYFLVNLFWHCIWNGIVFSYIADLPGNKPGGWYDCRL